jgi:hypothetical protein
MPAPPLYPDEPVFGGLARCSRWLSLTMGNLRSDVLQLATRRHYFMGLGAIEEAALLFRTTPENLLWNHTHFPFVTAFTPGAELRSVSGVWEERRRSGINKVTEMGWFRVCKKCMEEDIALRGESYWHRSHLLPGTFYCVKHKCLLHMTTISASDLATNVLPADCELLEPPKAWVSPGSFKLAQACVATLHRAPGPGTERSATFYLNLAQEKGLLPAGVRVSQLALKELFLTCFHTEFLKAASVEFSPSRAWPAMAFQPNSAKLSSLRQLMVETALRHGHPAQDFLRYKQLRSYRSSRPKLDARFSAAGIAVVEELLATKQRLPLHRFLKRIGATHAWENHKWDHPRLVAVVELVHAWNRACPKEPRGTA